jgi:hypothetical protein
MSCAQNEKVEVEIDGVRGRSESCSGLDGDYVTLQEADSY